MDDFKDSSKLNCPKRKVKCCIAVHSTVRDLQKQIQDLEKRIKDVERER